MISAFEISSVFRIIDQASPVLQRLSREMGEFSKLVNKTKKDLASLGTLDFSKLSGGLKAATDQVVSLESAADRAAGQIASSTKTASASVQQLTAQWRAAEKAALAAGAAGKSAFNIGAAARTAVPSVGGGSPRNLLGNRGSGGSLSFRSHGVAVPGGYIHGHGGSNFALAGVGALGYGAFEGLTASDLIWKGLANVYPEGTPEDRGRKAVELLDIVKREAKKIGQSPATVARMALDEIKVNANLSWKDRLAMMPQVIESGAREAYVKGLANPESAVSAFVGQLHQAKAFTPEEVAKYGPMLAYFAARDPNSIVNIAKSSAYHLPTLTGAMGVPVEEDLSAQTTLDQLGVGGKSGTWIRAMALKAAHPYLPLNASKEQTAKYNQQMAELKSLGLIDESGKSTIMRGGHYSTQMLLHRLADSLTNVPLEERANRLQKVFGARGSYAIAALTDQKMLQRYDQTLAGVGRISSNDQFWGEQGKYNPMQQARNAFSDLQVVLLEIGQQTLPTIVNLLKGFDAGLTAINKTLGSGMLSRIIGAAIGASVGGRLGAPGAIGGAVVGGALAGGGLPQIGPKSSAPELLDLLTKQKNDDAAKKIEDGAERGVLKGFIDFFKKGVTGGFSPTSLHDTGREVAQGARDGTFAGIRAALGGGAGGLINASFETPDGDSLITVDGVTMPRSEYLRSGSGAGAGGAGAGGNGNLTISPGAFAVNGQGAGINRDWQRKELLSNPALLENLFRHSLGENANRVANQAVMEEAANRGDLRGLIHGKKGMGLWGNLSYFAGYYRGSLKPYLPMLWDNFNKVFVQGSDISHGAIDNSSGWLARKHDFFDHRFRTTTVLNGEHLEVPWLGQSGAGEKDNWASWYKGLLDQAAAAKAAKDPDQAHRDAERKYNSPEYHIGPGLDESSTIPSHKSPHPIHIYTTLNLDGRPVAKTVMKHMAEYNHHPANGPRFTDNWTTVPIT